VIVTGDFNTPPASLAFRAPFGRLHNAFSTAGWGIGNTFFGPYGGVRVDHILYDDAWQARACWVCESVGAEHRPLFSVLSHTAQ
jgi:endonuclease/exonuclease/phosphatase (EEP) superfamily protein YafD